jgi:hypothetical protein
MPGDHLSIAPDILSGELCIIETEGSLGLLGAIFCESER